MLRRILLFIATNFLVMLTISLVINLLGIRPYLEVNGINYQSLMAFCAIWGMGGAFISLLMSKFMAKTFMGVQLITPDTRDPNAIELLRMVHGLAQAANLPSMPEVGIYQSPEVNAFATGPSRSNSLVAVSTGLLNRMNRAELEGVLGHEIAHIANGDMVTMTLIQGVINAFVMFFARAAAWAVTNLMRGDDERSPSYFVQHMLVMVFDILFGILGSIVVLYFSRAREYRADRGGAAIAGRDKMIRALEALRGSHPGQESGGFATLKISGKPGGLMNLFMTHPSLEDRIQRLRAAA